MMLPDVRRWALCWFVYCYLVWVQDMYIYKVIVSTSVVCWMDSTRHQTSNYTIVVRLSGIFWNSGIFGFSGSPGIKTLLVIVWLVLPCKIRQHKLLWPPLKHLFMPEAGILLFNHLYISYIDLDHQFPKLYWVLPFGMYSLCLDCSLVY